MCQVLTKRTKTDNEKKRLLELNFKWSLIEEACYVKINKCESCAGCFVGCREGSYKMNSAINGGYSIHTMIEK